MKRKIIPTLAAIATFTTIVAGFYYLNKETDTVYLKGTVVELGQCVRRDGCALVVQAEDGHYYHLTGRNPSTIGRPVTLKFYTRRGVRRMTMER